MKKNMKRIMIWGGLGTVVAGGIFLAWNQRSGMFPNLVFKKKDLPTQPTRFIPHEEEALPTSTMTRTITRKG